MFFFCRYGINIKCLSDVYSSYTYRSEVHCGEPAVITEDGYYCDSILGITLRLLEKYGWNKLKAVNLTTDNLYTSLDLMEELEKHNMTLIGTMRKNKRGIHPVMTEIVGRDINSTVVWWEAEQGRASITSYVVFSKSAGKKAVLVLTNYPDLADLGITKDDEKFKSGLLKVYDFTKVGTDKNGEFTNTIQAIINVTLSKDFSKKM